MSQTATTGTTRPELGRTGVTWSSGPWDEVLAAAPELEELGYSTIWISGGALTELGQVADLARVTRDVTVGTGIIAVDRFDSESVCAAYAEIEAAHPGRFVVGVGGAHGPAPLRTLGEYLDRLDRAAPPVPRHRRVLAALGPRMLELARDRTAGALPVLATAEYTAQARARLGPDALLIVQQLVVLETNARQAREIARRPIGFLLGVEGGYRAHFQRMGLTDEDIATLSDRLVDALMAWGDLATISRRVAEQHAAGADHVAVTVLPTRPGAAPIQEWRVLATVLTA